MAVLQGRHVVRVGSMKVGAGQRQRESERVKGVLQLKQVLAEVQDVQPKRQERQEAVG